MEKVTATFDKDSRNFHRFLIDEGQGIVGMIYFPRKGEPVPDEVVIALRTPREKDEESKDKKD